ncbi:type II toxin-antitoxin system Phd/YefM family antitoxin [Hyphococcus flavus]|uniref:Antitoxin n=1 Tax=Hyphococcus flavus TaxID=1866326 RepID=A0AAE9ZB85_9PROT|nr:type II toxin-antitoxin system Phd/YefM family antitoxin [Hyphococcus flavus]WDI30826.1 type II toxin-antitoxin system Phd/YefM family antitoxin [Hyphococcus flavus]
MKIMSAFEARYNFSSMLDAARRETVIIERYHRPAAYVISVAQIQECKRLQRQAMLAEATAVVAKLEAANDSEAARLSGELSKLVKDAEAAEKIASHETRRKL